MKGLFHQESTLDPVSLRRSGRSSSAVDTSKIKSKGLGGSFGGSSESVTKTLISELKYPSAGQAAKPARCGVR